MNVFEELEEMLYKELKEITKKGDLSASSLESAYKIVDILKDICEIRCSESDGGYSRDRGWTLEPYEFRQNDRRYMDSNSYGRSYMGGMSNRGYSRTGMREHLEAMMNSAQSDKERDAIQKCMDQLGV